MDQKKLREWEGQCIREEPPACTARCPLQVDARLFLRNVAQGKWDDAVNVLAAIMPLPGIVGRICNHPCESVCRRASKSNTWEFELRSIMIRQQTLSAFRGACGVKARKGV